MRKRFQSLSVAELAAVVTSALTRHHIEAVLTGGACVSIYSQNRYASQDLDFVSESVEDAPREILRAMAEIGFKREPAGYFSRPRCAYVIEFLPPPLAIGREPVRDVKSHRTALGQFKMLSPTECVKDRLAAFYHWGDRQSLEQARLVAQNHSIRWSEVSRWSKGEGKLREYQEALQTICKNPKR